MKSRLTILTLAALFLGACTSGTYVTSSYTDDIYFTPGDVPPPIVVEEVLDGGEPAEKSAHRMIISDIQENEKGSQTMNNYIFDGTEEDADALVYSMDQYDLYQSDTTVYYNEDDVTYVINNYYDGDEIDFAYRIRRFHRPYFYDPFYWDSWYYDPYFYDPYFYSSWYYPSWSFAWNWGWGYNWYSPYYSWGWGYSPYYSYWSRPYSGYYGWGYPYHSWYGGGWYADSENYRYGQRRSTGTNVYRNNDGGRRTSTSAVRASAGTTKSTREGVTSGVSETGRRAISSSGVRDNGTTRSATNSSVITERRRTTTDQSRESVSSGIQTRTYTRPGTSSTATRTYTRPATKSTTTPRVVTPNRSSGSGYTAPQSTSTYNRTYRSNSTYNRSSSSSSATRTYRAPSTSTKSGSTYSSPSRSSSSSGSYRSSGSSSSGSYSTPSSSGSSRSSSSSSSGRRR